MSLVKHIEQIKLFIIQNIYFFGQLFLLAATFVIWKFAEALFSFHADKSNTTDKDVTENEEESRDNEMIGSESVEEKSLTDDEESKFTKNEEKNIKNFQTTTKIQIESHKENETKQLSDKNNELSDKKS